MEKKEQKGEKRETKKIDVGRIIWSADVDILELGRALRGQALPRGTVVKLDRLFFETCEKREVIEYYQQELGHPIFVDAKIIEIPSKCLAIAETYLKHKPFMLSIMAGACSNGVFNRGYYDFDGDYRHDSYKTVDCLKQFAEACAEAGTRGCGVTVLTSKRLEYAWDEFSKSTEAQVVWYARQMSFAGMTDIVCSAREAATLSDWTMCVSELTRNVADVRLPPGKEPVCGPRPATPAEALEKGADRLIIDSDLTDGEGDIVDRLKRNYERLLKHLEENGYEVVDLKRETPEPEKATQGSAETEKLETK